MTSRAREISFVTGIHLRHRGFRKVKVNGLTPEGGPPRALHHRVSIICLIRSNKFNKVLTVWCFLVFILLVWSHGDCHTIMYLSFEITHLKKTLVMDCIFLIAEIPVWEVIGRIMWRLLVLISFTGDFISSNLKLWKLYHYFLFLLNIPILLQSFIRIMLQCFSQMPDEFLTVWCPLVAITVSS